MDFACNPHPVVAWRRSEPVPHRVANPMRHAAAYDPDTERFGCPHLLGERE